MLLRYKRENGVTQRALAAMVKRSEPTVSLWLAGETRPDLDSSFDLEDQLGIPARAWVRPRNGKSRAA